jgi:hypothetical protein
MILKLSQAAERRARAAVRCRRLVMPVRARKRGDSVEPMPTAIGQLLSLLEIKNANRLRQSLAQFWGQEVLDVVNNVRRLEPRLGNELRRRKVRPNYDVTARGKPCKSGRDRDAFACAVVSNQTLVFLRHNKEVDRSVYLAV